MYDLIVCGAGPAGASAAAAAAQAGLKVALLEKQPLPRHKTCGGGMPMVVQNWLRDLAPEAFVEATVSYMRHTWQFADAHLAAINPPDVQHPLSLWMVQRSVFDHALAERAARAGVDLRDGMAVRSLEVESDRVIVRAQATKENGEVSRGSEWVASARYVIGADGANGVTVKSTNLRRKQAIAIAMEVEYPYDWSGNHPDLRSDVVHLEYGAVHHGYAWIFPKGNHLNVGAGVFRPNQLDSRGNNATRLELRQAIFGYLDLFGLAYQPEQMRFHAHPLPLWNGKERLHTSDGRILLAGDAAGLINPLFGDGIFHAVKSGLIAADCVTNQATQTYTQRIHAEFAVNFDAALKLSQFFYQFPGFCYKYGVKRERATHIAAQLLCGELPFTDLTSRAIRRIRKSMFKEAVPLPKLEL